MALECDEWEESPWVGGRTVKMCVAFVPSHCQQFNIEFSLVLIVEIFSLLFIIKLLGGVQSIIY
jgi:hypothetical protein